MKPKLKTEREFYKEILHKLKLLEPNLTFHVGSSFGNMIKLLARMMVEQQDELHNLVLQANGHKAAPGQMSSRTTCPSIPITGWGNGIPKVDVAMDFGTGDCTVKTTLECRHDFKEYRGFSEDYKYCTKCDHKE